MRRSLNFVCIDIVSKEASPAAECVPSIDVTLVRIIVAISMTAMKYTLKQPSVIMLFHRRNELTSTSPSPGFFPAFYIYQ